jgi:hypothetical protein
MRAPDQGAPYAPPPELEVSLPSSALGYGDRVQNPDARDSTFTSRSGYVADLARSLGEVDDGGKFTEKGWNAVVTAGLVDSVTGAWLPVAAERGVVPPAGVGQVGPIWLQDPGQGGSAAPTTDPAGAPLDASATMPVELAEVIAVEGGGGSSGGGGYSRGGGGYSRRSYGGGGGYSGGGGGGGGFSFGGGSFGSGDFDDSGWEDFLKDFDRDGDTDEKDEVRARKMAVRSKRTRRGKRGGKSTGFPPMDMSNVPTFPESEIRTNTLAAIEKSKKKGK